MKYKVQRRVGKGAWSDFSQHGSVFTWADYKAAHRFRDILAETFFKTEWRVVSSG